MGKYDAVKQRLDELEQRVRELEQREVVRNAILKHVAKKRIPVAIRHKLKEIAIND